VSNLDFFAAESLPAPRVGACEAAAIVRERFGIEARLQRLGSQQDQNYLLLGPTDDTSIGVLKLANPAISSAEVEAQDLAADLVAASHSTLRMATTLHAADGSRHVARVSTSSGDLTARVIRHLDGGTLRQFRYLSPTVVARLGTLSAQVGEALREFEHPGLERVLQWDLRHADRALAHLLPHIDDADRRERVRVAGGEAWATVAGRADALPIQAGHFDLTDENVVVSLLHGTPIPDGVIDFGDLTRSWGIGELAITISSILHHPGAEPSSVLPAVLAYDRMRSLSEAELEVLWPLVVLRGAVLVTSAGQQIAIDGEATHASNAVEQEWAIFDGATSVPCEVMTGVIRHALDRPVARVSSPTGALWDLAADEIAVLDLGTEADTVDEGAWLEPDAERRLAAGALERLSVRAVVTRHGAPRLTRSQTLAEVSPATVPTGIDIWLAEPNKLAATQDLGLLELKVERVEERHLRLTLALAGLQIPAFVRPEYAPGWLALTADPTRLLGLEAQQEPAAALPTTETNTLLARREAAFATVQGHYYAAPPRIERGWRHQLADVNGRAYLDMVNNVTAIGHAHPAVERAVTRQLRRLNTNSRFHYGALVEYSQRLAALLPDGLDTVFLVNSGSEAVDLALRLAFAYTGRQDVVAVREAYHGWTYLSDAVSTSVADNPNAVTTRPEWVHTVDSPNQYRGVHPGPEASRYAPEAVAAINKLVASGRPPAAFIAESFYGNAGGIPLPDGYLRAVYDAVRTAGGLAIADEIQVGYGRLGEWFWGFEQQGAFPDVVAVAKAIGNGHPLGAVITRREIAESYRTQGYFFSSAGGSPVSCVAGLAVLDVIESEALQANAREVGRYLKRRLLALMERHELIGAVHGSGLYVGVEFVRDLHADAVARCRHPADGRP
jgi:4-aminobutyrate aminotransferase-like enzyme/Ser/Thr protein kinase RdoA (MazF antagonist)